MSIKQAIEALPPLPAAKTLSLGDEDGAIQLGYTADQMRKYALAALRSMTTSHTAPLSDAWISVDERLPKPWEDVLIYPRPTGYCCEGQVDHKGQWAYSEYEAYNGNVKHKIKPKYWMPLPPPPIERAVLRGGEK